MEKLAITCRILYNHELLETKKELRQYKKRFDIPKIKVDVSWFQRSWNAQRMLDDDTSEENNYIQKILFQAKIALNYVYQEEFVKNELFFEEKLKELKNGLEIVKKINESWREDTTDDIYDFTWHFLNRLFESINWMYCSGCEELVKTCKGLCNKCDVLDSPDSLSDREFYMDNQDMLADAMDH